MALLSPDEADNTSKINAQIALLAETIYQKIERYVKEQYIRGRSLTVPIDGIGSTTRSDMQKAVQDLCGDKWRVKLTEIQTGMNEYEPVAIIEAADEPDKLGRKNA